MINGQSPNVLSPDHQNWYGQETPIVPADVFASRKAVEEALVGNDTNALEVALAAKESISVYQEVRLTAQSIKLLRDAYRNNTLDLTQDTPVAKDMFDLAA